jgi:hypothetical protein
VPNNTIQACGPTCQTCAPRANSSVTCNGTSCVYACDVGFHACGNVCASDNSAGANCTSECITCPTGQTCVDNVCTAPPPQP